MQLFAIFAVCSDCAWGSTTVQCTVQYLSLPSYETTKFGVKQLNIIVENVVKFPNNKYFPLIDREDGFALSQASRKGECQR